MSGGIFEKNEIKEKILIFDDKILQKDFWKDKLSAQKILKEKKRELIASAIEPVACIEQHHNCHYLIKFKKI